MRKRTLAFVGPESTGKTTLSRWVAEQWGLPWIEEVARQYLEHRGPRYRRQDVIHTALLQWAAESRALARADCVVSDTHLLVYHIWLLDKFGDDHPLFHDVLLGGRHVFYLLTAPDIPWVPDPLREDPHRRHAIFRRYVDEIARFRLPHAVIRGNGTARRRAVADVVRRWIGPPKIAPKPLR